MIKPEYKDSVILLESAINRLIEVLSEDISKHPAFVDATIQRFEFSFELFWKALKKKLLYDHGIESQSPKSVLSQAYVNQLISNEKMWLDMLQDRNLTSHTYNQKLALEIYKKIKNYGPFLQEQFVTVFKN